MYIIKFNDELYYCGNKKVSSNPQDSKLYVKKGTAKNEAIRFMTYRKNHFPDRPLQINNFSIIEVELIVKGVFYE